LPVISSMPYMPSYQAQTPRCTPSRDTASSWSRHNSSPGNMKTNRIPTLITSGPLEYLRIAELEPACSDQLLGLRARSEAIGKQLTTALIHLPPRESVESFSTGDPIDTWSKKDEGLCLGPTMIILAFKISDAWVARDTRKGWQSHRRRQRANGRQPRTPPMRIGFPSYRMIRPENDSWQKIS